VVPDDARGFDQLGQGSHMQGGQAIDKPVPIFPRYVEEERA